MSAIQSFREVENNTDMLSQTTKQMDTVKDMCTMVRPAENTNDEGVGNYATMVFNGKPDFLKDNDSSSSSYYGTMVFRGNEYSGTMVSKPTDDVSEEEAESNEPSFMKYFRKTTVR